MTLGWVAGGEDATLGGSGNWSPAAMGKRKSVKKLQVSVCLIGELVRDPLNVNPSKAQGLVHDDGPAMVMYIHSNKTLKP